MEDLCIYNQDTEGLGSLILKGVVVAAAITASVEVTREIVNPTARRIGVAVNTTAYKDPYGHKAMMHNLGDTISEAFDAMGAKMDADLRKKQGDVNTSKPTTVNTEDIEDAEITEGNNGRPDNIQSE